MTVLRSSLDGGIIDLGFWGPDQSKVQLGELPPISTQQFAGYGILAVTEGLVRADYTRAAMVRAQWGDFTRNLRHQVTNLATLTITGQFFGQDLEALLSQADGMAEETRSEWLEAVSAAAAPTDCALYYKESPFIVQADGQRVGLCDDKVVKHVISYADFFALNCHILQGGNSGWKGKTYSEVKAAVVQLDEVLTRYGSDHMVLQKRTQ